MTNLNIDPAQLSAGGAPIPGDAPAGKSVREDARFSDIRQEIDKLTSISPEAGGPDWAKVAELSTALLTTLGKDISVASWLAASLMQLKGEEGIAGGALILADLCENYWDTLLPPPARLRARMGAIDWWQDQVDAWLEKSRPEFLPGEVKNLADEALRRLDETVGNQVADNPLRLHVLRARLSRIPSPPEPVPAAPATETPAAASPVENAAGPASPDTAALPAAPALAVDASAAALLSGSVRFCLDVADALLSRDLSLPASYLLRRAALWCGIVKLPPAEGGKTAIPPPEDHILPGLTAQLAAGEQGEAIRAAESNTNAYVYWLDLSRISAEALSGLGQAHDAARRSLEGQMASLIHRFPELPALSFADGRPFADGATRQWLGTLAAGQGGPADPFLAELDKATANPPEKALAAIGELLVAHPGDKYTLALYQAAFTACRKGSLWPPLPYLAIRLLDLIASHRLSRYDAAAVAEALAAAAEALAAALAANADNPEIRTQYACVSAELAGLWPHRLLASGA